MQYRVKYISNNRIKQFTKTFKSSKHKDLYISKKIKEGATSLKVEHIRSRAYNVNLEKEIVSKKKKIVSSGCIYALIHKDEIVYIGQTYSIMGRLNSHINSNKVFDHYSVIEWIDSGQDYLDKRESEYIKELKPKYNSAHNA